MGGLELLLGLKWNWLLLAIAPASLTLSLPSRRTLLLTCLERTRPGLLWSLTSGISPQQIGGPQGPHRASWTGRRCWEVSSLSDGWGGELSLALVCS